MLLSDPEASVGWGAWEAEGDNVSNRTALLFATLQVVTGLYLGNIRGESGEPCLAEGSFYPEMAAKWLCPSQERMQHFKESIKFIHECRLHGGGCLVHCLAGVSRSTTILVAYLMTVTELGWERCLAATKAVRSYASPNFGFQQQLQEYEQTLLKEVGPYRAWIRRDYGRNPFKDQEELQSLLAQKEQSGSSGSS
uniref:Uncharacterized protein n=1 Tax=Coturnix japonica TaxID=93934 RepID=A0A8C2TS54_COTJA